LKEALTLAAAELVVLPDPNCWIRVCREEARLPSYWPALAALVEPAAAAAPVVELVAVELAAPVLPRPSDFNAANSECKKLCTFCDVVVAALPTAAVVVPAAVEAVVAAVVPAAAVPVRAVVAAAAADVIPGIPVTCCSVCSRLLNSPCVVAGVELEVLEVELLELEVESVLDAAWAPFLWP
jgi:hypothetical protein